MSPQPNPIIHLNQDISQAHMRDHTQHGFPQRFDGRRSRGFLILGQIQGGLAIFDDHLSKLIGLPAVQHGLERGAILLFQHIKVGIGVLGGRQSCEPTGLALRPGRRGMQIRSPDLVLSASRNREVRGAEQFAHLLGQAELREVFGGMRAFPLRSPDAILRGESRMASICREPAPPLHIHPFEGMSGPEHQSGGTGAGKFERGEQIGQKLAEKGVMMVE